MLPIAPAVLAAAALLTISASSGGQTPAPAPAKSAAPAPAKTTAPAAPAKSAAPAQAAPSAAPARGAAAAQPAVPAKRPPAPTLSKPVTPSAIPTAQGFIPRWMLLEPIPFDSLTENAVRAGIKKEYFPNQFSVIPKDGDKVTVNGKDLAWHAVDTKLYNVNLYHFAWALSKETSNVMFWTVTVINCPQDIPDVRLAIGSNAASVWWLNGQEVASLFNDRQTVIDDAVGKRLTLKKGANILRAVIVNAGGATDFCARFLDANDKPLKGYTVTLTAQ